jgi:hypothetical protein
MGSCFVRRIVVREVQDARRFDGREPVVVGREENDAGSRSSLSEDVTPATGRAAQKVDHPPLGK